MKATR